MCVSKYLRVCLIAYLFLCANRRVDAQHEQFSETLLPYYEQALNFDFRTWPLVDIDTLNITDQPTGIYINSLAATLQTVIQKHDPAAQVRDQWVSLLSECNEINTLCSFVSAEVIFHQSLIYFFQGDHFKSFLEFRKVYRAYRKNDHPYSLKTSGTLNVMLGSVPEQYQWVLNLLGYRGDEIVGMKQLDELIAQETLLTSETLMIKLMFQQYLFDQDTFTNWLKLKTEHPHSPLRQFLFNGIALKNHQSQYVIDLQVDSHIDQVYGQLGEAYLNKLEYDSALIYFDIYEDNLGDRMTSEMLHKIWLTHQLKSDSITAKKYAEILLTKDESISEADENALFNLQLGGQQDLDLMKIRLTTDGGYYESAEKFLNLLDSQSLSGDRSQVEYIYRKARWLHLSGQPQEAVSYYVAVIEESPRTDWYFAPNTAYQLGKIYENLGELDKALEYYKMIKDYRNYPYRNSLESKSNLRMRIIESTK